MNYKKQRKNNYTLHLINDNRFKTITVSMRFSKPFNKEEIPYLKLLESVLINNGTKKYPTIKDLSIEAENLYKTNILTKFYTLSKNMVFEITCSFINPIFTEENIYKKVFAFLKEIIENPLIKNNKWKEEIFNLEKQNLIKTIENVKDTPDEYARLRFEENFFKGTVYGHNNYKNIEDFKNITNEELYKTYKKLFNSFKIDVLVFGDFDEDIIVKETDKLLTNFTEKDETEKNLYIQLKNKKYKEDKESIETSQSNLFIGLTIKDITDYERDYVLILYNTILGSMNNSVLFVSVREDESLCYSIGSIINKYTNTIIIDSGIGRKNYDLAKRLIQECIENMKNKKFIYNLLTNAKKTLEIAYNDFYDNIDKIINYQYFNEFTYTPSIEERRKEINKITEEEISSLAKKVEINYIYLLEGVNDEEN